MTSSNSPEQKLIEALELSDEALSHADDWLKEWAGDKTALNNYFARVTKAMQAVQDALPIARSLLSELAELREKEKMLEYVFHYHSEVKPGWIEYGQWLTNLRRMIEQKERHEKTQSS